MCPWERMSLLHGNVIFISSCTVRFNLLTDCDVQRTSKCSVAMSVHACITQSEYFLFGNGTSSLHEKRILVLKLGSKSDLIHHPFTN